MASAESVRKI